MELLSPSNGTISQNLSKVRAIGPIRLLVLISLWSLTNQIVCFALTLNISGNTSLVASWFLSFYLVRPSRLPGQFSLGKTVCLISGKPFTNGTAIYKRHSLLWSRNDIDHWRSPWDPCLIWADGDHQSNSAIRRLFRSLHHKRLITLAGRLHLRRQPD